MVINDYNYMTFRNNETFRVYVVMPLLPAFEGEIGKSGAYAIKAITHYNYTSICKGSFSLWQNLRNEGIVLNEKLMLL